MIVAVTGASGHVGANLVRALVARGDTVRVLVHDGTTSIDGLPLERVPGDVLDSASLHRLVDGAERVFHLAAKISLDPAERPLLEKINIEGPRNMIAACKAARVKRLVHFSSIHAFSANPREEMIDEDRPLASGPGLLPYDATKAAGERVVRNAIEEGFDAVIVNPTGILGPIDYGPSHMGEVLQDLYHGRLPGGVDAGFNWVDVRDVVSGALEASERAPRGARYLLAGHWHSFRELLQMLTAATGKRRRWLVTPMWLAKASAPFAVGFAKLAGKRPLFTPASLSVLEKHQRVSFDKAQRELGYCPRPIAETIRDTFDWLRTEGKLE